MAEGLWRIPIGVWRTLTHPLVSSSGVVIAAQYAATALGFLTNVVAARLLGPAGLGVAALIVAYPSLLYAFVSLKSQAVIMRYLAGLRAEGRHDTLAAFCTLGYLLDAALAVVVFLLVAVSAGWVAEHLYRMAVPSALMVAYAASFPFFSLTGTSYAVLSSWHRFGLFAAFQVLDKALTLGLVFAALMLGAGIKGMVLGLAIGHTVSGAAVFLLAVSILRRDGVRLRTSVVRRHLRPFVRELRNLFGWNYVATTLGGIMMQVPLMILARFRSPQEAGFFRLSSSLAGAASSLESAIGWVTYPRLSTWWSLGARDVLASTLRRWTIWAGLPMSATILLTVLLLGLFIPPLFGSEYRPMILGAQVMMAGVAISLVFFWLIHVYYSAGRIDLWTKVYAIYTGVVLGLAWWIVPRWGFLGLAVLTSLGKVMFTLAGVGLVVNIMRILQTKTMLTKEEQPRR